MNAIISPMVELIRTAVHTVVAYAWWGWVELISNTQSRKRKSRAGVRHALLLAWGLPPTINGGVYRPTSFLKYGTKLGWRMSAIAGPTVNADQEAGHCLLNSIPKSVPIYRLDPPALEPSWRIFSRVDGGFLNALATAQLAFQTFKGSPPSTVIASGPPFHNFVAAYYIAKYFRAKLVLDYRDEWTEGTREFIRLGNVDRLWEARCLESADAVFFATQGFLDIVLSAFSHTALDKCHVLHNGWDPDEFEAAKQAKLCEPPAGDHFVLSFIGRSGRFLSPEPFLTDLDEVFARRPLLRDKIRIRFVGKQDEEALIFLKDFQRSFPGSLEILSQAPKPHAIQIMEDSSGLLLLNNEKNSRVLPGKIFEYIATGPPILLHGAGGEMGKLVSELSAGVSVAAGDTAALEQALMNLANDKQRECKAAIVERWLEQHTREALARRFFDILEEL